jgi:hypothetical protein
MTEQERMPQLSASTMLQQLPSHDDAHQAPPNSHLAASSQSPCMYTPTAGGWVMLSGVRPAGCTWHCSATRSMGVW